MLIRAQRYSCLLLSHGLFLLAVLGFMSLPGRTAAAELETVVIREDYSIRENGSYRGYESREIFGRSYLERYHEGLPVRYSQWYGTSAFRREDAFQAKELDFSIQAFFLVDPEEGEVPLNMSEVPLRLNIPFLPGDETGDDGNSSSGIPATWEKRGADMFILNGRAISVQTQVVYTDRGNVVVEGRTARQIDYRYPLRLQSYKVRNLGLEHDIRELFGSVTGNLYLYQDLSGGAFMKERIYRRIVEVGGTNRDEEGFRLVWLDGVSTGELADTVQRLAGTDSDNQEQTRNPDEGTSGDVIIEQRPEGVVMTLPDIHFVPDRAEILPDEMDRLDRLADALKQVATRHFLVIGHTADVGTRESQVVLSQQRAQVIVEQLVARGLAPNRFLHDGVGGSRPLASNETEEGRRKNRRVEVLLLD